MINIIFLATPDIAVNAIKRLSSFNDIKIQAVVTQIDKPAGRGNLMQSPPVKQCAVKNGIKVYQTKSIRKDEALISELKALSPDFFVTFAFGQILSQEVLDIPKIATINLHASLLPKYRGANPIQRAIVNGETQTGICTMITQLGLDEGDICLTEKIDISENMNCIELSQIIADEAPFLIYKTIKGLFNNEITPLKQNNDDATYADKFEKSDGFIDWQLPAKQIHNKIRGLLGSIGTYFIFKNKKIKIIQSKVISDEIFDNTAQIKSISKNGIEITTSKGLILIEKIKPEGKNEMNANDWNNGVHLKIGDYLL